MVDGTIQPRDAARMRLRALVRGAYDEQKLRIQTGLRLCANFKARLGQAPGETEEDSLTEVEQAFLDKLRDNFKLLTTGIAKNRTLPSKEGFRGNEIISDYTDLVLIAQYLELEATEAKHFRRFEDVLPDFPIYNQYLKDVVGVGPALAGILISEIDIHNTPKISNLWSLCGLDVAKDGLGRSRRKEHLVIRQYTDRDGAAAERNSITFNPLLKTKITGVLATSFLRTKSPWADVYYNYKGRLESDPNRPKADPYRNAADKKMFAALKKEGKNPFNMYWRPQRIHQASLRYMAKMFLADFWLNYRRIEGLEITPTYHEAVLGHKHTGTGGPGPTAQAAE